MHAYARKLPPHVVDALRKCRIDTVSPFALMPGPTYVFLPKNKKFLSVKSPLDFFSPEELERFKVFGDFYLPQFIDEVSPFRSAGISVRNIVQFFDPNQNLDLVPYEASDGVLRVLALLWGRAMKIDPLCLTVFCNELFGTIPKEIMERNQSEDIERFELRLFRSSLSVFFALHLGYLNLKHLEQLRDAWFSGDRASVQPFLRPLIPIAESSLRKVDDRLIGAERLKPVDSPLKARLFNRILRIQNESLHSGRDSIDYDVLLEGLWPDSA